MTTIRTGRFVFLIILLAVILIGAVGLTWAFSTYRCAISACPPASQESVAGPVTSPTNAATPWIRNIVPGLWLCLFSGSIVFLPRIIILMRFQIESGSPPGINGFKTFQSIEYVWRIICLSLSGFSLFFIDLSHVFTLLALLMAALSLPAAFYSGIKGIYLDRSRWKSYFFQHYKDLAKQLRMASKYSELKIVGWTQGIFLTGLAAISLDLMVG